MPGGVQPGTSTLIATGDDRVQSVGWAVSTLWVSYTTACTPSGDSTVRSCIRVDAIHTPTNSMDQDTNTAVAGQYLYYGALTPLRSGVGFLMVFGYSGSLTYPSIGMTGQNSTDSFTTYRGPIPAYAGSFPDLSGRYGDYSGIQMQFSGTKQVAWGASEFDTSAGWATEVISFAFY